MEAFLGSVRAALCLVYIVLFIFSAIIFTGWFYLLRSALHSDWGSAGIAFLLSALALIAARQFSHLRSRIKRSAPGTRWYYGWQIYLFLAFISAVGTINAAFVVFEARAIVREDVSSLRRSYADLENIATKTLTPTGYREKVSQLEGLLTNLRTEIYSPMGEGRYCGVGKSANDVITKIQEILPEFRRLNGSGPIYPCDIQKEKAMYDAYATIANKMIRSSDVISSTNGVQNLDYLDELELNRRIVGGDLDILENESLGLGPIDSPSELKRLVVAKDTYNEDRSRFLTLAEGRDNSTRPITVLQSDFLNSYAKTFELFYLRLGEVTTWVYIGIAFAVDFITIYLLTLMVTIYSVDEVSKSTRSRSSADEKKDGPIFLSSYGARRPRHSL